MNNDTISDFLAQLKNAYLARHKNVEVSYAKILLELGKILKSEGYISEIKTQSDKNKKTILIELLYTNRKPAITDVKRVSKPGLRVYVSKQRIPYVYGGLGTAIISTPKGVMTGKEAKKQNIGGEVLCKVW